MLLIKQISVKQNECSERLKLCVYTCSSKELNGKVQLLMSLHAKTTQTAFVCIICCCSFFIKQLNVILKIFLDFSGKKIS